MKLQKILSANTQKYRKTPKGVLTNIYQKHKARSLMRGWPMPDYDLKWLHARFLNDKIFLNIFIMWVKSNYKYYEKPSIDRIDNKLPYLKTNIQILSWRENRQKGDRENSNRTTSVIQCDMSGIELKKYNSVKEAVVDTGLHQALICACCVGRRNHTGGFKWKYGEKMRYHRQHL